MNKHTSICRCRKTALSVALAFLLIYGLLVAFAPGARAAVSLLYFKATARSDRILVEWETATEQDTLGFNLYRSLDSGSQGDKVGDTFPVRGDGFTGAQYSYPDTDIVTGKRYYYSLEEIASGGGGLRIISTANAGIDVPTLTPTPTATATGTSTPTATHTPSAANPPGGTSGDQPTATRQFTLTPRPIATEAAGSTPTPLPPAPATETPIGTGVVSTPTGGPQPPSGAAAAPTVVPEINTPPPPTATMPPAPPTPSPAPVVDVSTAVAVDQSAPTATPPPQVFAAATAQPVRGTPRRAAADPTPVPAGETTRNTGSIFLLGGGAILLAAAIGGGVLLYLRSRKS